MSRVSKVPRFVVGLLRRAGYGGRQVWVPALPEAHPLLRTFLEGAEVRVHTIRDARRTRVRQAWRSEREEAAHAKVAPSTMHELMQIALGEIQVWWKTGERERVERVLAIGGEPAYLAYQRYRLDIANGTEVASADPRVLAVATESIAASWWRQRSSADEFGLVEEAARLAILLLDGGVDTETQARCTTARIGLPASSWHALLEGVDSGVARGTRDLETRRLRSVRSA